MIATMRTSTKMRIRRKAPREIMKASQTAMTRKKALLKKKARPHQPQNEKKRDRVKKQKRRVWLLGTHSTKRMSTKPNAFSALRNEKKLLRAAKKEVIVKQAEEAEISRNWADMTDDEEPQVVVASESDSSDVEFDDQEQRDINWCREEPTETKTKSKKAAQLSKKERNAKRSDELNELADLLGQIGVSSEVEVPQKKGKKKKAKSNGTSSTKDSPNVVEEIAQKKDVKDTKIATKGVEVAAVTKADEAAAASKEQPIEEAQEPQLLDAKTVLRQKALASKKKKTAEELLSELAEDNKKEGKKQRKKKEKHLYDR
eukprot:GHVO01051251.1.p2 GENE.GHVO01051251.1~~GHVO01051251.1.p2  ORF type:complete len:315 (-),score=77.55 GHVO01051251.1:120-1064(-)